MRRFLFSFVLATFACAPGPRQEPRTLPSHAEKGKLVVSGTARRVVLVSFDGLGADALARQKHLSAFEQLARDGASARVVPVNPTSTSSTHATIVTGAEPQRHGVVANRFHLPGTPVDATARGLETELDSETIIEAARRQGKRVGAIPFPSVDGRSSQRRADFGIVWTPSSTVGAVLHLRRADFHRAWVPPTWTSQPSRRASYSPVMRTRIEWSLPPRVRTDVDLVAYDTTDDSTENYDSYHVEIEGVEVSMDSHRWFAVSVQGTAGLYGSWSKLLRTTPDLDVQLYWGAISRTIAYPDSYRSMIDAEVGFWPGTPDEMAEIDPATFAEQLERLSDFLTRAQTLTISRMEFDLLLAYQSQIDEAAHNFLGYDDANIDSAFAASGRAIQRIRDTLDPAQDTLIVTGDHGYAPVAREVRMNRLLGDLGAGQRWRAYAAGNVAHLYRFQGSNDTAELARLLKESGYFERIDVRQQGWHRNSGDIIAWAAPGTVLSPADDGPVVAEPDSYAQHGALNTHREMHTILLGVGPGLPAGTFTEIRQTALARMIAQLLGIQPPAGAM